MKRVLCAVLAALVTCEVAWAGMFGAAARNDLPVNAPQSGLKVESMKSSATTDVSDLWWNPNESGWGNPTCSK